MVTLCAGWLLTLAFTRTRFDDFKAVRYLGYPLIADLFVEGIKVPFLVSGA